MYRLFDLQRLSMENGPGLRTTLFFEGCPLRCVWCHNPEGLEYSTKLLHFPDRCIRCGYCQDACPIGALSYDTTKGPVIDRNICNATGACASVCPTDALVMSSKEYTLKEIMDIILKDRAFYDRSKGGVTFSGGEPLSQNMKNLSFLMDAIKKERINLCIDTSGYVPWENIEITANYADSFLYDFKHIDTDQHRKFTAVNNERILENLVKLSDRGAKIHIRIPVIPGFNGDMDTLERMADWLAENVTARTISLLPYHRFGSDKYDRLGLGDSKQLFEVPDNAFMSQAADLFKSKGLEQVFIGGALLVPDDML
ncbi:MAG: glycyl-radical enzyme activating protein [Saccharofermentanales bacterium]|jgi:pyruvate formate lyase activating enzyme|nr:glycyl-radical enzyme activating protein [Bacillota bacterium]